MRTPARLEIIDRKQPRERIVASFTKILNSSRARVPDSAGLSRDRSNFNETLFCILLSCPRFNPHVCQACIPEYKKRNNIALQIAISRFLNNQWTTRRNDPIHSMESSASLGRECQACMPGIAIHGDLRSFFPSPASRG